MALYMTASSAPNPFTRRVTFLLTERDWKMLKSKQPDDERTISRTIRRMLGCQDL